MKLEELAETKQIVHQTSNGNGLSIIDRGVQYIYMSDPLTGEVERRVMGFVRSEHNMGAVRD